MKRTAKVCLKNSTGKTLTTAGVVHKYSDVYKSSGEWETIAPGETTSTFEVSYNTGFGTTGQDWWMVTWGYENGDMWVTAPRNFRGLIDTLESVAAKGLEKLRKAALEAASEEPVKAAAAAVVATLISQMLSSGSTAGFKSYILRSEDEGKTVTIEITSDNQVNYFAPSGDDLGNPAKMLG